MSKYANVRTNLSALIGLLAAAALLSGCAQSATGPSPTPSAAAPTSSPAVTGTPPTAEQTTWAGEVCTSTTTLKSDVQGLVTAATDGGNVEAALSAQMATVKESAATLTSTVKAVPAGSEDDPERVAVTNASDNFTASITALEASVAAVQGTAGEALVAALKGVATAASTSLVALGSMAQAITTAAADGTSTIGQAFDAAPECDALTK